MPANPAIDGLQEPLRSIVNQIITESGGKVTVSSGFRTLAEQQALYNAYLDGTGNPAARPGTSMHEHGLAVDFGGDLALAQQLAAKHGLVATVPGEAWHFQLGPHVPMPDGSTPQDSMFNLVPANGAQPLSPEEVLANRLHMAFNVIGSDVTGSMYGVSPAVDSAFVSSPNSGISNSPTPAASESPTPALTSAGSAALHQMQLDSANTVDESTNPANNPGSPAHSETVGNYQQMAQNLLKNFGWSPAEMSSLIPLWNQESGWNPNAQNPHSTAYGIAQFLNGTWAGVGIPKTSDPLQQITAGLAYIKSRYGSPSNAWQFHIRNGWY